MYLINTAGKEPELVLLWNLNGELNAGGRNGDLWHIVATNPFAVPLFAQVLVGETPQHPERVVVIRPGAAQRITLQPIELTPHTLSSREARRSVIQVKFLGGEKPAKPLQASWADLLTAVNKSVEARVVSGMVNPSYEVTIVPRFSYPLLNEVRDVLNAGANLGDVFDTPSVADITHFTEALRQVPRAMILRPTYTYN